MSLGSAFQSPESKRAHVRGLFATIADRYDFITRVLSYGQDRRWKARLIREARVASSDVVLDLACGTGDIALLAKAAGARRVVGLDLTQRMLVLARNKGGDVPYVAGDMGALPIAASSVNVVTTGYGLRNVPDLDTAIGELARVVKPGGRVLSLDFNRPESAIVRWGYLAYSVRGGQCPWMGAPRRPGHLSLHPRVHPPIPRRGRRRRSTSCTRIHGSAYHSASGRPDDAARRTPLR